MTQYVAFLRAINVGGHIVKMDRLRGLFEALGCSNVATFIASGNVIFDSTARNSRTLESAIAKHLEKALGYDVPTFIRSAAELRDIAAFTPFPKAGSDGKLYVGFFADVLPAAARKTALSFRTEVDEFQTDRRELYWLCRAVSMLESKVSYAKLEKVLGAAATFRNVNTVRRIAAILR